MAKPSDLQSWGRKLARRIGAKKATVAVARKLDLYEGVSHSTGRTIAASSNPTKIKEQ